MLKQYYDLKIKELEEELQRTAAQIVPAKKFTIIAILKKISLNICSIQN